MSETKQILSLTFIPHTEHKGKYVIHADDRDKLLCVNGSIPEDVIDVYELIGLLTHTTDKHAPTNQDIFARIAATVEMYQEDKMTMDEALKIIVGITKDVV